jgi:hypothetical protein
MLAAVASFTPPDVLASDQFTGVAAALNARTLDAARGGGAALTWTAPVTILGTTGPSGTPPNSVVRSTASTQAATVTGISLADMHVSAVITALPLTTSVIGPIARTQGTTVTPQCYGVRVSNTGGLTLFKIDGVGTLSSLGGLAAVAGVGDRIGVRVTGSAIQCTLNGTPRISAVDTTTTAAGTPGIRLSGTDTTGSLGDFLVETS